ncbi:MAG: glycerol-3-phosphate dehydrogenase/oxidase, partial [Chloroflexi bacterium]
MTRREIIEHYRNQPDVSVLIIGGGVNGIGTFRDLALNGVDVLLVEKNDFCSAASAANSHMVHGGLRYLEYGEFRLVKEALRERNLLLQNAPHYVHPLPTTIPIFHRFSGLFNAARRFLRLSSKPSHRGALIIKVGLMLYDLFTRGQQTLPRHQFFSREESLRKRPKLNPAIVNTAQYYDAWMPYPERICLEMILDAEATGANAHALNYVKAVGANGDTVTLSDELSGERFTVRPQIVVNASGPWIDFTNRDMGQQTTFIGGTKGAHLVVDHRELLEATVEGEIFFENEDGRITLFFPIEDRVLMGSTDIPVDDPDAVRVTDEEIDYILESVRLVFPTIDVKKSDVVYTFTGVRPLPHSDADTPGAVSRDHSIRVTEAGNGVNFPVLSLVGGKWTTFRAFSEQTADRVLHDLKRARTVDTAHEAIGGGKNYPQTDAEKQTWLDNLHTQTNIPRERLETLFKRYGTRAASIAAYIANENDAPLSSRPDYSRCEIAFIAAHEKVHHL